MAHATLQQKIEWQVLRQEAETLIAPKKP